MVMTFFMTIRDDRIGTGAALKSHHDVMVILI